MAVALFSVMLAATPAGSQLAGANSAETEAAALMKAGADAIERGHYDRAAVDFSNALDSGGLTHEGRALAWHHRGVAFQKTGQQDAAIADYSRAIDAGGLPKPVLARAHYNRGIAYGQAGENDAAERDYRAAIELSPGYAAAYHNLANLERRRGAHENAILSYTAALEYMQGRERRLSLYGRALAHERIGDMTRAEADLRQALAIDPEFDLAATKLASLQAQYADLSGPAPQPQAAEATSTARVVPSTITPFQAASSGNEGAQIIRISSIGGWRTTATRLPREETPPPALMADAAEANDEIITGSLRPGGDVPRPKPMALAKAQMTPVAEPAAARYRLQLGAFREEALAERAWREVSTAAQPIIGSGGHAIQKADLGEKGVFYRLQAGAFGEISAAKSACKALEQRKIACFVVEG
ncbi:tetratricopeptide repeat protein [Parvibaculum sp.]|uniref:SPOR domain-containing protein n=1 Tax=Parvibaculum sp. TaxID=2024848 RepID=UPI00391D293F